MKNAPISKYPSINTFANSAHRKAEHKQCISLLDEFSPNSKINKSEFRGAFNLIQMMGMFFLWTKPLLNFFQTGNFFSPILYNTFKTDFFMCLFVWPLFYFWSYTSFLIQKAIIRGLSPKIAIILQHMSQTGIFVFALSLVISKDWCASHSSFVIMQTCVHFMKMHSFSVTNRDYREQIEQSKASNKMIPPLSTYPHNITFWNFTLFMWTPVLVYDESIPRRPTRDWLYIAKKTVLTFLFIMAAYLLHTDYIMPNIQLGKSISFIQLCLHSTLPVTQLLILIFYIVFECILNIFAELTRLADRGFYDDWWNATTFQQFNRLWNKPVHNFLYRHLYLQCILRYGKTKKFAQFFTFAFSAVLHELILAILFRIIMPIMLVFMIAQIPLIYATKSLKGTQFGNYLLWFGLTIGPSLIICMYLRIDENVTNLFSAQKTHPGFV